MVFSDCGKMDTSKPYTSTLKMGILHSCSHLLYAMRTAAAGNFVII